ncbi:MAG TPA: ATP phosphoribosyltransferase regulatory subunit [Devosiaceae bacterium]
MSTPAKRRAQLATLVGGSGVTRISPPILMPADPYYDLAGEEFARRLVLTQSTDGFEYCLRPDFTLAIAKGHLAHGASGQAAYGYFGPVFRQRDTGPTEFDQAGLELIGQPDAEEALRTVFAFARAALDIYRIEAPAVRLGGVALFEAILRGADIPSVWRSRIRHRFGHSEAMQRLLERLADPHGSGPRSLSIGREALVERITDQMLSAGLSLTEGRRPQEIADRYLEKQALAAARVPVETLVLLRSYLGIAGEAHQALSRVEALARDQQIDIAAPLERMRRHIGALEANGPMSRLVFDAGFSPRLDYYTGIVFEMTGPNGEVLASGGQYDRLLERLGAKGRIAAAGCAVWVQRLEAEAAA